MLHFSDFCELYGNRERDLGERCHWKVNFWHQLHFICADRVYDWTSSLTECIYMDIFLSLHVGIYLNEELSLL